MRRSYRIGLHIFPSGAFWVQVNEAVATRLGDSLVAVDLFDPHQGPALGEDLSFVEHIQAQQLDALICVGVHPRLLRRLCDADLPIVYLFELGWTHPRLIWPTGLYQAGRMAATYLAQRLGGRGQILAGDGYMKMNPDAGASRMAGIRDALAPYPDITLLHSQTSWRQDESFEPLREKLASLPRPPDGVIGLDDDIALAARAAARSLGIPDDRMLTVGINGDPLALAAILQGSMSATVRTAPTELAAQAADLAFMAVRGEAWPQHFDYHPSLVTSENAREITAESLSELAMMPSRLVGVNRLAEQDRLRQLELSAGINRRVGALLDRQRLTAELEELIKANYGYDAVHIYRWSPAEGLLYDEQAAGAEGIAPASSPALAETLRTGKALFIPDAHTGRRWPPDARHPDMRTRAVLPIQLDDEILGLLDVHSIRPRAGLHKEIVGLQATADYLAVAIRNADLYGEAVRARGLAEKADQLKTRLLANVSHELRTPLNIILGYSKAALTDPALYGAPLPDELRGDLGHIYDSGEHLVRLINDLLDLSRAEIGELNLFPEAVSAPDFLAETFEIVSKSFAQRADLTWRLITADPLPTIEADPVRLRQVLLNLLNNAAKFTQGGEITLGAEVAPPHLHFWVADTGPGIPPEQQEVIFQPFAQLEQARPRQGGVGLGLSITRRLVALHAGTITLESRPGRGSTFHVYLPLPTLSGRSGASRVLPATAADRPRLWVIAPPGPLPADVLALAQRLKADMRQLSVGDEIERLAAAAPPTCIAWVASAADAAGWSLIERLRGHPQLSQLPFVMFAPPDARGAGPGVTHLLTRPASRASLLDAITALRPHGAAGPILVVDDDPHARKLTVRAIEQTFRGAVIAEAADGAEALAWLETNVPALIALDLVMPGVDGFAVLEQARRDPRTRCVPVLVLSGKLLTLDELLRLNQCGAAFQRKGILDEAEQAELLRAVLDRSLLPEPTGELVKRAVARMHEMYAQDLTRDDLAAACGVSAGYLSKIFRQEMGLSVNDYLVRLRVQMAQALLQEGRLSITEVAGATGFADPAYFSRVFHRLTGQSARDYRHAARG